MKIGIIGGGQLAQMLAWSAVPLGIKTLVLDPNPDCPASLAAEIIVGDYDDLNALQALAKRVDVITYEFENVPTAALKQIKSKKIFPSLEILEVAQERLAEKQCFVDLKIPTTEFYAVNSEEDLIQAAKKFGYPFVVKTRRMGYDGKGQAIIRAENEVKVVFQQLGGQPLMAENWVEFQMEVSQIAVRDQAGKIYYYPLTLNVHRDGILRQSHAPYDSSLKIAQLAVNYTKKLMEKFNYVGVMAIEFFVHQGGLIANEMAPRVHNSGHWTIEGAVTSQFQNHMRAIAGLPLGCTDDIQQTVMINLIGNHPPINELMQFPDVYCHFYGKTPAKGRKLGHLTLVKASPAIFKKTVKELFELLGEDY